MEDIVENIKDEIFQIQRESGAGPQTFLENWQAFIAAVDWNERWIQAILGFHVVLFVMTVLFRKKQGVQVCIFFLICGLICIAEPLNTFCAQNWQKFSNQDYFDEHGLFASTLYSGPLLVIGFYQLFNFLKITADLLVRVKRAELRAQQQNKNSIDSTIKGKSSQRKTKKQD
mmetsp:Transcript_10462/g.13569  ORF Transcript_10462/g.13569 Transcript_10462/m.13569 type:complete len:172 (-) Transcript_10462:163-678(-)